LQLPVQVQRPVSAVGRWGWGVSTKAFQEEAFQGKSFQQQEHGSGFETPFLETPFLETPFPETLLPETLYPDLGIFLASSANRAVPTFGQ
jgi:hypothetical protein